jgi:hypothetical protein
MWLNQDTKAVCAKGGATTVVSNSFEGSTSRTGGSLICILWPTACLLVFSINVDGDRLIELLADVIVQFCCFGTQIHLSTHGDHVCNTSESHVPFCFDTIALHASDAFIRKQE